MLDHEAETYETERLKLMDVLREPTHELSYYEKLTVTFVHKWKHGGEKEGWWRRARLVARQYKWASEMGDEETFSPASVAPLSRHLLLLAQEWNTPIWICDVKDAYLNVEQPHDEPVVVLIGDHYFELATYSRDNVVVHRCGGDSCKETSAIATWRASPKCPLCFAALKADRPPRCTWMI